MSDGWFQHLIPAWLQQPRCRRQARTASQASSGSPARMSHASPGHHDGLSVTCVVTAWTGWPVSRHRIAMPCIGREDEPPFAHSQQVVFPHQPQHALVEIKGADTAA